MKFQLPVTLSGTVPPLPMTMWQSCPAFQKTFLDGDTR